MGARIRMERVDRGRLRRNQSTTTAAAIGTLHISRTNEHFLFEAYYLVRRLWITFVGTLLSLNNE